MSAVRLRRAVVNSVPSVHGGPAKFGDRLASRGYPMEDVSTVRLKVGISQGKCGKIFSICNFNGNMTFFYQWEWLEQGKLEISGRISFQSEGIPFFQSHQGYMFVDVNIPKCSFYRFMAKVCRALRVAACSSGVRDQLEILPSGTSDSSLHPANLTWNIWHPHESTKEKVEDDNFPIYFPIFSIVRSIWHLPVKSHILAPGNTDWS